MFVHALAAGAARLAVPVAALEAFLSGAGIVEATFAHVTEEEWLRLVAAAPPPVRDVPPWTARAAREEMLRRLRREAPPRDATIEDLLERLALDALAERSVAGRKLRDVAFLVLDEQGNVDRAATRQAIALLEAGAPPARDELRDPRTGRVHVVWRLDELPQALAHVDPLFPDEVLVAGVSQRFQVVVRPRLGDEAHQLLLLLRQRDKVPRPEDRLACEELVRLFAAAPLDALLERFAARGVYEKAARQPGGLPSIVRVPRQERPAVRHALERLDAFLRGRASAAGNAAPRREIEEPLDSPAGVLLALANRLPVATLAAILRAHGIEEPFPSPRVADYAARLVEGFEAGRVTFAQVLERCDPHVRGELGDGFLEDVARLG